MEDTNSSIYALKTSAGQERNVARLLARKARTIDGIGISSILVPESLKGYILVESSTKIDLRNPDLKVQHLRGVVEGSRRQRRHYLRRSQKILKAGTYHLLHPKRKYCGAHFRSVQRRKGKSGSY